MTREYLALHLKSFSNFTNSDLISEESKYMMHRKYSKKATWIHCALPLLKMFLNNVISSILSQGVQFNELAGVWILSKQTQTLDVFTVA